MNRIKVFLIAISILVSLWLFPDGYIVVMLVRAYMLGYRDVSSLSGRTLYVKIGLLSDSKVSSQRHYGWSWLGPPRGVADANAGTI